MLVITPQEITLAETCLARVAETGEEKSEGNYFNHSWQTFSVMGRVTGRRGVGGGVHKTAERQTTKGTDIDLRSRTAPSQTDRQGDLDWKSDHLQGRHLLRHCRNERMKRGK